MLSFVCRITAKALKCWTYTAVMWVTILLFYVTILLNNVIAFLLVDNYWSFDTENRWTLPTITPTLRVQMSGANRSHINLDGSAQSIFKYDWSGRVSSVYRFRIPGTGKGRLHEPRSLQFGPSEWVFASSGFMPNYWDLLWAELNGYDVELRLIFPKTLIGPIEARSNRNGSFSIHFRTLFLFIHFMFFFNWF